MPPDEFGAWGQWAGAMGSLLAVVVALWVAISDVRRRDRERKDLRSAQARTVLSRVSLKPTGGGPWHRLVEIENHGTLPVTNVVVEAVTVTHDGKALKRWIIFDGKGHKEQEPYTLAVVIGPGDSEKSDAMAFAELEYQDADETTRYRGVDAKAAEVQFSFVDAEGLRWRRIANGAPIRIIDPPGPSTAGA